MYETELSAIMQKEKLPRMRVNTDWGNYGNIDKAFAPITSDEWRQRY
jgi:hypothetical protein